VCQVWPRYLAGSRNTEQAESSGVRPAFGRIIQEEPVPPPLRSPRPAVVRATGCQRSPRTCRSLGRPFWGRWGPSDHFGELERKQNRFALCRQNAALRSLEPKSEPGTLEARPTVRNNAMNCRGPVGGTNLSHNEDRPGMPEPRMLHRHVPDVSSRVTGNRLASPVQYNRKMRKSHLSSTTLILCSQGLARDSSPG